MAPSEFSEKVLIGVDRAVGRIHLNRPETLNSLNLEMCQAMSHALKSWRDDDQVKTVVITGEGRGLCAGGDVVAVRQSRLVKRPEPFFRVEYLLNQLIADYPKPIVPIMHGIVMGGGLGISAHASHRIVTSTTHAAMPEARIGFWCDVGMCWPLTHNAPGQDGVAFALTAFGATPAETIALGLADAQIKDDGLVDVLIERLAAGEPIDTVMAALTYVPEAPEVGEAQSWIDECFAGNDIVAIMNRLKDHPNPDAREAYTAMREFSPLSLHVILKALRYAEKADSLAEVLAADLRIATHYMRFPTDFVEGVRAQLVDKDKQPVWRYHEVEAVPASEVKAFFTGTYKQRTRAEQQYRFLNQAK